MADGGGGLVRGLMRQVGLGKEDEGEQMWVGKEGEGERGKQGEG